MPGHITSVGKGKYRITIEAGRDPITGKRKRIVRMFHGRKPDAQKALDKLIAEYETGSYIEPSKMTMGNWLDVWLNDYKKLDLRPTTWESYEIMSRVHIKPAIGHLRLQDIRPDHLQQLYASKLNEGKSSQTVRYIHAVIHGALDQALKNMIVPFNVSKAVTLPAHNKKQAS